MSNTTENVPDIHSAAIRYLEIGAHVIPIYHRDGAKAPACKSEIILALYNDEPYDQALYDQLSWSFEKSPGLAIICGRGDDEAKYHAIDFDDVQDPRVINLLHEKIPGCWLVESGHGFHLHFRSADELPDNRTVWRGTAPGMNHLEVKWNRTTISVPPSTHPEGKIYQFLSPAGFPTEPPAIYSWQQIQDVFTTTGVVLQEYAEPEAREYSGKMSDTHRQIIDEFDLIGYFNGLGLDVIEEGPDRLHVEGFDGLIVNPSTKTWKSFGRDLGGGLVSLIQFLSNPEHYDPNDQQARQEAWNIAADESGLPRPYDARMTRLYKGSDMEDTSEGTSESYIEPSGAVKIQRPVQAVVVKHVITTGAIDGHNISDTGNSERFLADWGDRVRFNTDSQQWMVYDGTRWTLDRRNQVQAYVIETIQKIYRTASRVQSDSERKRIARFALSLEGKTKRMNMLSLASLSPKVAVIHNDHDLDPKLFNVMNGTYDLGNDVLLSHSPTDMLTKRADVEYIEGAGCPLWLEFLNRIFQSNPDLIQFIQRLVGLCLSGLTVQNFFFLYGKGSNGKSTFVETIRGLLGDYGRSAPTDMLFSKDRHDRSGATPEILNLKGARLAVASEVGEGRKMDEPLIKTLTGSDTLTARGLWEGHFIEFAPTHKLVVTGNHKPIIVGNDEAIWRRPILIPFVVTIPEAEQRPVAEMLQEFAAERPGILNWALVGWRDFRAAGLQIPPCVKAATKDYRVEQDVVGEFVNESLVEFKGGSVAHAELFKVYRDWAERNGFEALGSRRLIAALENRGLDRFRGPHNLPRWRDISFRPEDSVDPDM